MTSRLAMLIGGFTGVAVVSATAMTNLSQSVTSLLQAGVTGTPIASGATSSSAPSDPILAPAREPVAAPEGGPSGPVARHPAPAPATAVKSDEPKLRLAPPPASMRLFLPDTTADRGPDGSASTTPTTTPPSATSRTSRSTATKSAKSSRERAKTSRHAASGMPSIERERPEPIRITPAPAPPPYRVPGPSSERR
jgi:hypothetical protein